MGGLVTRRCYRETGTYTIPNGQHDVEFDFNYALQNVLVSCVSGEYPVCYGDLDWFSITLLDKRFIIHANIQSDSCDVSWMVI